MNSLQAVEYSLTIAFLLEEYVMILGCDHTRMWGCVCVGGWWWFWSRDLSNISSGQILYDPVRVTLRLLSADW